jgi:hypothetical protein
MLGVMNWPVTISDAPIRCGFCGRVICGSGTGTITVLKEVVALHRRKCPRETTPDERKEAENAPF